ncbi:hypothetical protein SDRG_15128 [Saprolegnia diclina VS20]|uniref:Uncharacterized protein n=1 Tax=Saprolegnia diclina (strain VS20) TaxID=1156394 RepID=T0PNN7_SAPDV|nr:hypothetical protein SDRG_15128 [Saprolegnia diclina VS20]EQC27014.1 hypothetical protein SDRG_15128 [Saprolegnia diclina VS20]|eukprot:XP_008619514.1 hypothetical protein SDRG_15128 [Saprolegnia diclina VS20]
MDDEAGFTKFVSGDTVYARARRLHRATTGRTTKRFVANWDLEIYLETMRRTPPPPALAAAKDTTDYAAESATAAKKFMQRIHKSETHGCASFSEYLRWDRRRFHDYGCEKRNLKPDWAGEYDDDTAAAADAMQEMHLDASSEAQENELENDLRDEDEDYDFCDDIPDTNAGSPRRT